MKSSGLRSRLAALVTTCIACVCLLSLSSATAWAKVGTFHEFPVPTAGSQPSGITKGPDGKLWFTEHAGNKIGRIVAKTGTITEFVIPTASSGPAFISAGPALSATVWFTERSSDKIGEVSTK